MGGQGEVRISTILHRKLGTRIIRRNNETNGELAEYVHSLFRVFISTKNRIFLTSGKFVIMDKQKLFDVLLKIFVGL